MRQFLAGLALAMLAGCVSAPAPDAMFDLRVAPSSQQGASQMRNIQLLVPMPVAVDALATDRILVRPGNGQGLAYLEQSRWSDRLPALLQARIIESLQAGGVVKAAGRPGDGLAPDEQLETDITSFEFDAGPEPYASVVLALRLVDVRSGKMIASSVFSARERVAKDSPPEIAAAMEAGLQSVLTQLNGWAALQPGAALPPKSSATR